MKQAVISVLGAGSWGTAVAIHIAKAGYAVNLWSHSPQHVNEMIQTGYNQRYLKGIPFPKTLRVSDNLQDCAQKSQQVMVAVPSHAFSDLLDKLPKPSSGLAWLTKGIDPATNQLLSELVARKWNAAFPITIISGPSFAREVAAGLPTALVLASNDTHYSQEIQAILHAENVRVYSTDDIIGVQLAGAVKNVLAIACGVSDGLNFGANAKAALITRGLAEMRRLGVTFGAASETFLGLAGVGDLVLTCTDDQSRNRRFGLQLGRGIDSLEAEKQIGQVVEGKGNARQICLLAESKNIDMPICNTVQALLTKQLNPLEAFTTLMKRPVRME